MLSEMYRFRSYREWLQSYYPMPDGIEPEQFLSDC